MKRKHKGTGILKKAKLQRVFSDSWKIPKNHLWIEINSAWSETIYHVDKITIFSFFLNEDLKRLAFRG